MVATINEKELSDLYLLGAKGRHRLHKLADSSETKMIETVAMVDPVFQQRRLLEGNSTAKVFTLTKLVETDQNSRDDALGSVS